MEKKIILEDCDVVFCTGNSWISKLIKWWTKSEFSHVAFFVELEGLPFIVDAQKDGVNVRPLEEWRKKYNYKETVLYDPLINDEAKGIRKKRALKKAGVTPYDFLSTVIKQPFKLMFGRWLKSKKDEDEKMNCSEFQSYILYVDNWNEISPAELFHILIVDKGYRVRR